MNNYFDNTICSRTSVERYLLNRMTTDEETLFQEHLPTCNSCSGYLKVLRNVAGIDSDESLHAEDTPQEMLKPPVVTHEKKQARILPLSVTWRRIILAACLIPICLITLYCFLHEPGIAHDPHINHQHKASVDYTDTFTLTEGTVNSMDTLYLLFPTQPVCTVNPTKEDIIFRWNRECDYQLRLETDGKTVATIDSMGMTITIDSSLVVKYNQLEWTLILGGKKLKGTLNIQTK